MVDDKELVQMTQVLQSNTSLLQLCIKSPFAMRYTFESLTKFVEIVTAPESKSQLELFSFGHSTEDKDTVTRLSSELTSIAASRGHPLKVLPMHESLKSGETLGLTPEQVMKAQAIPDSLLYGKMTKKIPVCICKQLVVNYNYSCFLIHFLIHSACSLLIPSILTVLPCTIQFCTLHYSI